jgi:hypothetical protein
LTHQGQINQPEDAQGLDVRLRWRAHINARRPTQDAPMQAANKAPADDGPMVLEATLAGGLDYQSFVTNRVTSP